MRLVRTITSSTFLEALSYLFVKVKWHVLFVVGSDMMKSGFHVAEDFPDMYVQRMGVTKVTNATERAQFTAHTVALCHAQPVK